jgi:hypothetical protein
MKVFAEQWMPEQVRHDGAVDRLGSAADERGQVGVYEEKRPAALSL